MISEEPVNLSEQLLSLQTEHRQLDEKIHELHTLPYADQLKLQRLKREKLRLKEQIEYLKDQLIPDMDA